MEGACDRFNDREDQVEMHLYVGKFAGGGHEDRIRSCAETQVIGGAPLWVIDADEEVAAVREVARSTPQTQLRA